MMRYNLKALQATAICLFTLSFALHAEEFNINQLPPGQSLTLPHQATTLFTSDINARFSATDLPQSLKINTDLPVKVIIMDPKSKTVKAVALRPGLPYLYNFAGLGSVALMPEQKNSAAKIRVESNKPLEIARM